MNGQTKNCQNCKKDFTIESEDFAFYEKIKVPPPTWCPECRFQRRLTFRNERVLYKRDCDLCGQDMVTIFAPEKPIKVYCSPCWWSDKWDPLVYAQEYDPARTFFDQFNELLGKTPWPNLINGYSSLVRSDYVNHAGYLKDCYLIFNADKCENVHYGAILAGDKDSMDLNVVGESELCYWAIDCHKSFSVYFSEGIKNSHDVWFSKDCAGSDHLFGCAGLRKKSYYIFNVQYTKEKWERKVKEYKTSSYTNLQEIKIEAQEFWKKFPQKFNHGLHNTNASGDYVYESKNAKELYLSRFVEDGKWCQWITLPSTKDAYDYTEWGAGAERIYEAITAGEGASGIKFCFGVWSSAIENEYSILAVTCSSVFGCANIKNKKYCILNKEYSKEDFEALRVCIVEDMNKNPYVDSKRRVFAYGEFFPPDLSRFAYNETSASQYFPLTKEEAVMNGFRWRDQTPSGHTITMPQEKIPDNINDVTDDILKKVIGCGECDKAFRVIKPELDLLRRFSFPLPRKCSDCRHMERLARLNPPRFVQRTCQCSGVQSSNGIYQNTATHIHGTGPCHTELETSYAPDRPEIVYCESCYNSEVA